jgi:hypothetical protein
MPSFPFFVKQDKDGFDSLFLVLPPFVNDEKRFSCIYAVVKRHRTKVPHYRGFGD